LVWQRNLPYLSRIKAAVDAHLRPTAALLEQPDPHSGWTSYDYRLLEALSIIEREKCPTCGNPVWLCHSYDNTIEFEVKVGNDYAKAAIEEYEKDESKPKLTPGQFLYATAVGIENEDGSHEPLPSRREVLKKIG
jgi:hypothetical protein